MYRLRLTVNTTPVRPRDDALDRLEGLTRLLRRLSVSSQTTTNSDTTTTRPTTPTVDFNDEDENKENIDPCPPPPARQGNPMTITRPRRSGRVLQPRPDAVGRLARRRAPRMATSFATRPTQRFAGLEASSEDAERPAWADEPTVEQMTAEQADEAMREISRAAEEFLGVMRMEQSPGA